MFINVTSPTTPTDQHLCRMKPCVCGGGGGGGGGGGAESRREADTCNLHPQVGQSTEVSGQRARGGLPNRRRPGMSMNSGSASEPCLGALIPLPRGAGGSMVSALPSPFQNPLSAAPAPAPPCRSSCPSQGHHAPRRPQGPLLRGVGEGVWPFLNLLTGGPGRSRGEGAELGAPFLEVWRPLASPTHPPWGPQTPWGDADPSGAP